MTKEIVKTANGIILLKHDDAFYLTADPLWHMKNLIQITDILAKEIMSEFGIDPWEHLK